MATKKNARTPVWMSVLATAILGLGWLVFESGWLDTWLADSPAASSASTVSAGAAGGQLDELTVAPAGSMDGYSRDRFEHWISQPSSGKNCNTREAVLKREGKDLTVSNACKATAGKWTSAYNGETVNSASKIDIDHMVPLANAWRSGANKWNDDKREQLANDLKLPQLLAVDATSNRAKGDQDPSTWKPTESHWCDYATNWITVKHSYQLTITSAEKTALQQMLAQC